MLTFEVHEGLDGALVVDRSVYCFQWLPSTAAGLIFV